MSVEAISLLQDAEKQAEKRLAQAAEAKRELQAASQEELQEYQKALAAEEEIQKKALQKQLDQEWLAVKEPLVEKNRAEIERLRSLPEEKRAEALALIIDKVVT